MEIVEKEWKILNQEIVTLALPTEVVMCIVNLTRMMETMYSSSDGVTRTIMDGYTHPQALKDYVSLLLVETIALWECEHVMFVHVSSKWMPGAIVRHARRHGFYICCVKWMDNLLEFFRDGVYHVLVVFHFLIFTIFSCLISFFLSFFVYFWQCMLMNCLTIESSLVMFHYLLIISLVE